MLTLWALGAACAAGKDDITFSVSNPRSLSATEIARVSVPVPAGLMPKEPAIAIVDAHGKRLPVQASVITRHPDGSVRRVMLSFPVQLAPGQRAAFSYGSTPPGKPGAPLALAAGETTVLTTAAFTLRLSADLLMLSSPTGVALGELRPFGPTLTQPQPSTLTVIENGPQFAWLRWRQDGTDYSREVDVLADKLGRLRLTQRVLRRLTGNGWTPDFGFDLLAPQAKPLRLPQQPVHFLSLPLGEPLASHLEVLPSLQLANGSQIALANPLALRQHRGTLE
ncbi:MAG: hypothetical protein WCP21_18855, partial [Armatimonadota bacterium]